MAEIPYVKSPAAGVAGVLVDIGTAYRKTNV
jgi:hypothetical protein